MPEGSRKISSYLPEGVPANNLFRIIFHQLINFTLHSYPWISSFKMIVSEDMEEKISGNVTEVTGGPSAWKDVVDKAHDDKIKE